MRPTHTTPVPGVRLAAPLYKAADGKGRPVAHAVLTYPVTDYDGDFVRPDGGDWATQYPKNPQVNWHHGTTIGLGAVALKSLPLPGGLSATLPVGTTRFFQTAADLRGIDLTRYDDDRRAVGRYAPDECLRVAEDAHRLVADGVATGVSLELLPVGSEGVDWDYTGHTSLINNRPSYRIDKWVGLGWAHTLSPVNPHARTFSDSPAFEKAIRLAETGRFPGGKQVHAVIRKSLQTLAPARRKAISQGYTPMDETELPAETAAPDAEAPAEDAAATPMTPTPAALMTVVQGLADMADYIRGLTGLEHEGGLAKLAELADSLQALSAEARADTVALFPSAGLDAPDDLTADEIPADGGDPEMAQAEDGALLAKAFRKGIPGTRFRMADARPAGGISADDPKVLKALGRTLANLQRKAKMLGR